MHILVLQELKVQFSPISQHRFPTPGVWTVKRKGWGFDKAVLEIRWCQLEIVFMSVQEPFGMYLIDRLEERCLFSSCLRFP